jgi:Uma2 family endonuclease
MFEREGNYTIDEFLQLVGKDSTHRYEYWHGQVRMMTGGSPDHARLISALNALLYPRLEMTDCVLHTDAYVLIHDDLWLCPDLAVSCDPQDVLQPRNILSPALVIEVLFPGTASADRGEKAEMCRRLPMVQEYLLIDSQRIYAELYRRESEKLWTFHVFSQGDTIELRTVGMHLTMDRLYLKTSLSSEDHKGGHSA